MAISNENTPLTDLYAIVDELVSKGVSVKFLKEGQIYSKDSTPIAKLMLGLLGSVAEFERWGCPPLSGHAGLIKQRVPR